MRLDWARLVACGAIHSVWVELTSFASTSDEAGRTERRLLVLVRSELPGSRFGLRRRFIEGPGLIECAFQDETSADRLAAVIGARRRRDVPAGYASLRVVKAELSDCQKIWRLGAQRRLARRTQARADR